MEWSSSAKMPPPPYHHEWEWEKLMMPTPTPNSSSISTPNGLHTAAAAATTTTTTTTSTTTICSSSDLGNTSLLDLDSSSSSNNITTPTTLNPPSEPLLIGLKLGKRTYFEDVVLSAPHTCTTTTTTTPPPPPPPPPPPNKRSSNKAAASSHHQHQTTHPPRCQVQGCNLDLSSSKDYHRRHRVCDPHSKSPKVLVAGLLRRFCQQCSRFHDLSDFDDKKRSCRRRLSDHNARRRKPHQDALQFINSPTTLPLSLPLPSSFYDNTQHLNALLNALPLTTKPTWESSRIFKPGDQPKASFLVSPKAAGTNNGQLNLPTDLPNLVSALHCDPCRLVSSKGTTTEALNQGIEAPGARNLDATTDLPRALSLLSNNSWRSGLHEPASLDQLMQANQACITQPMIQTTSTQSWPVASSEFWQAEEQPAEPRAFSLTLQNNNYGSNQFQEFQLFKAPFDSACTWNRMA